MSSTSPSTLSTTATNRAIKKRSRELLLERRNEILIVKINRPQGKNALNRNAVYELMRVLGEVTHNKAIRVMVITGVGDIFTAGTDLKQMNVFPQPADYTRSANAVLRALIRTFMACPKLLVCLVNGPCIGIGFTLAALCDAVYCTKNAYFQAPFTKLGLCPEACSSRTFPLHFGQSWSTNLLVFGERLSAQKAEQLGFVLQVFENPLEVEEKFWCKLDEYGKLPWDSVRITKRLIRLQCKDELLLALDAELKEIEKLRRGPIYQEAIAEFVQKSKTENELIEINSKL